MFMTIYSHMKLKLCTYGAVLGLALSAGVAQAEPLAQKLQSFEALQASFTQTVTDPQGQEIASSEGTIALKRPQSFMLHTQIPDESYLYTRDDGVYYFDAFINQLTIMPLSSLQNSPFALLLEKSNGNDSSAWQDWEVQELIKSSVYELKPKTGTAAAQMGGASAVRTLKLTFTGRYLNSVEVSFADGNSNHYALSGQKFTVSESDFACTIPSDAEVADER